MTQLGHIKQKEEVCTSETHPWEKFSPATRAQIDWRRFYLADNANRPPNAQRMMTKLGTQECARGYANASPYDRMVVLLCYASVFDASVYPPITYVDNLLELLKQPALKESWWMRTAEPPTRRHN